MNKVSYGTLLRRLELGDRDYQYLAADKWFESLHRDPRFLSLLSKMRRAASVHGP